MKRNPSREAAASPERGFVIIAVLWILAALAALTTIFSVYLSRSARALAVSDAALPAEALVSASLELTTYQLLLAGDNARPSQGSFHFRMDDADVAVVFKSEAARIDLNFAPKDILANLFAGLGADRATAQDDANRIVGWRTRPAQGGAANDEEALYGAAGLGYSPRQSLFTHVNELALVAGLGPALVDRALPFVTVFNGSGGVDPLIAAPEVIAALPGMTSDKDSFGQQQPALPNDTLAPVNSSGSARTNEGTAKSTAFRVGVAINFNGGRRSSSEIVIALGDKDEPYHVLSWQDDVEPPAAPPKRIGTGWR